MTTTTVFITVNVEKVVEGKKEYFLATSPDFEGFMVEAKTFEELQKMTVELISDMLISAQKRSKKELQKYIQETSINVNFLTSVEATIPLYA